MILYVRLYFLAYHFVLANSFVALTGLIIIPFNSHILQEKKVNLHG